jgi:hypothetical protein
LTSPGAANSKHRLVDGNPEDGSIGASNRGGDVGVIMHRFVLAALLGALALALPAPGWASSQDFSFFIPVGGSSDNGAFKSSTFSQFDPGTGILLEIVEEVTGTVTWTPGGDADGALALDLALSGADASYPASAGGELKVDLKRTLTSFSDFKPFEGTGSIVETLETQDSTGQGTLSDAILSGSIQYFYTDEIGAVPEPSAWTMTLAGFAALALARRACGRFRTAKAT